MTSAQRELDKRISRAIFEYALIEEGDRVLIALSGGKDSLALAWNLSRKSRGFPLSFQAEALHLVTSFSSPDQVEKLSSLTASWGLNLNLIDHPSAGGNLAADAPTPTCFGCARDRRRVLLEYAAERNFTKIALGHHMNDSLITLLMNMSWNAELAAMPPKMEAPPGVPVIIRPLILVQESLVSRVVNEAQWAVDTCSCPWAGDSRRHEMAEVLNSLSGGSTKRTHNLWKSLSNFNTAFLPSSGKREPDQMK